MRGLHRRVVIILSLYLWEIDREGVTAVNNMHKGDNTCTTKRNKEVRLVVYKISISHMRFPWDTKGTAVSNFIFRDVTIT